MKTSSCPHLAMLAGRQGLHSKPRQLAPTQDKRVRWLKSGTPPAICSAAGSTAVAAARSPLPLARASHAAVLAAPRVGAAVVAVWLLWHAASSQQALLAQRSAA